MEIYNVAIIAHVDHGKTTLIDSLLRQSGIFRDNQQIDTRLMDNDALEKERGITIFSKCASVTIDYPFASDFPDPASIPEKKEIKINIVDTPGHADFGAEVERVLSMVDGVLLLVDSSEGVMPQTKFVLSKALLHKLNIIVIVNKIDKPNARASEVVDEIYDLFLNLSTDESQLNFPILYGSGRDGWCDDNPNNDNGYDNLHLLFKTIINHIPRADSAQDTQTDFGMLVSLLDYDRFLGRVLIGKIKGGVIRVGDNLQAMNLAGDIVETAKASKVFGFYGNKRINIEEAVAGDIIAVTGFKLASVADTINVLGCDRVLNTFPIEEPTISIQIGPNDSPLAGQEGSKLTSRNIYNRLQAEMESNVAIKVKEGSNKDTFVVSGRGELQLAILVENMRREGFELSISRPKVILKREDNKVLEPMEEVVADIDEEFSGLVISKVSERLGVLQEIMTTSYGKTRLVFEVPSRCLIGYHGEFLADTRGTGVLNKSFVGYHPYKGDLAVRKNGVLVAMSTGKAVAYALYNLQDRGVMLVNPQDEVYIGMVVGIHNKDNDLEINVLKAKHLTNIRAAGSDDAIKLTPPRIMSLEEMISFIEDDELLEVTPKSLRMRKAILDPTKRKRSR